MSVGVLEEIVAGHLRGIPRLTVQRFERLMESGVLEPDTHYELIDGHVVAKNRAATGEDLMILGMRHAYVTDALSGKLNRLLDGRQYSVRTQNSLLIDEYNQPEPDIVVIRGRGVDYSPNLPDRSAVLLLTEVAESSLEIDRGKKLEQYAKAGISTYWIVNLRHNQLEVYTKPNLDLADYSRCQILKMEETVEISLEGRVLETVSVKSILDGTI